MEWWKTEDWRGLKCECQYSWRELAYRLPALESGGRGAINMHAYVCLIFISSSPYLRASAR